MQAENSACLVLPLWLSRLLSVFKDNSVLQRRKNSNYLVMNTGISPPCLHWTWVTTCMALGDWELPAESQQWLLWKNTSTWEHCNAFKNYFLLIQSKHHTFHKFHHFPEVMVSELFFLFFFFQVACGNSGWAKPWAWRRKLQSPLQCDRLFLSIFQHTNSKYSCLLGIILITNKLYSSWASFVQCSFLVPHLFYTALLSLLWENDHDYFSKVSKPAKGRLHSAQGKSHYLLQVSHLEYPLRDITNEVQS